jgi:hypothetical protein
MRKPLAIGAAVVVLVAIPAAVIAASGTLNGSLDRQSAAWTTTARTTSSPRWRDVPRLTLSRCTRNQVTAMLNVMVSGTAPVEFRVRADGVPMQPGRARFSPDGTESFSFDFARRTEPVEGDDTHTFIVQWRSPSGSQVILERGLLNLLFQSCP